jgi:hypothetical protein
MSNGTGVEYHYRPQDSPTVFDHTQCAEISGDNFRAGAPRRACCASCLVLQIRLPGAASCRTHESCFFYRLHLRSPARWGPPWASGKSYLIGKDDLSL